MLVLDDGSTDGTATAATVAAAEDPLGLGLAWGIAIAVLATVQTTVALGLDTSYDPRGWRAYLIEPIYPIAYWLISGAAAARHETAGVSSGPKLERIVWDIPRED